MGPALPGRISGVQILLVLDGSMARFSSSCCTNWPPAGRVKTEPVAEAHQDRGRAGRKVTDDLVHEALDLDHVEGDWVVMSRSFRFAVLLPVTTRHGVSHCYPRGKSSQETARSGR